MTTFSPKEQFQRLQPDACKALQEQREASWLTAAFSFTLSDLAFSGATEAQLSGARMFIERFQNLWEKSDHNIGRLPEKKLTTYDSPLVVPEPNT